MGESGERDLRPYHWSVSRNVVRQIPALPTSSAVHPMRWSPDGTSIAYVVGDTESGELWLLRPNESESPRDLGISISSDGDFEWSPNSQQLAVVPVGTVARILLIDAHGGHFQTKVAYLLPRPGQIFDVAWSADGRTLAFTSRENEDFFSLHQLDLASTRVKNCGEFDGDARYPHFDPRTEEIVFVLVKAPTSLLYRTSCGSGALRTGFDDGVTRFLKFKMESSPRGADSDESAAILHAGFDSPACAYMISRTASPPKRLYCPPSTVGVETPRPTSLLLRSADDATVPALAWIHEDAAEQTRNIVVVQVHGGPRLHVDSRWSALTSILWNDGIDLIAPNYRGSDGYGYSHESSGGIAKSTQDVIAACKYARALHRGQSRVILLGISYGSELAAAAAAADPEDISAVVLLSITARSYAVLGTERPPFRVLAYQGQFDPIAPEKAKSIVNSMFGVRVFDDSRNHWFVLPEEGHVFRRSNSWIRVYSQLLQTVDDVSNSPLH
jgi:dipeptidyl aminopeptidase/acylaminoacyl peptidase